MDALDDLIAALKSKVVFPGGFTEQPHVIVYTDELERIVGQLEQKRKAKRVPRVSKRETQANASV